MELCGSGMRLKVVLSFHTQYVLIVAGILIADDGGIPHGCLIIPERIFQRVHALHGADHGGEVFIRQHLQGFVQNFLDFRRTKRLLGQLGRAHLDQQLDELVILADIPEPEHPVIDHLLVNARAFRPVALVINKIPKLLLAQWEHLLPDFLAERYTAVTDSSAIAQAEAPEVDSLPLLCPHTDTNRQVFFCVLFFEFQVQIAGRLLLITVAQEIKLHFAVSGAKGIKPLRAFISVQNKGDKTLGRYGFSRRIIAPQQDMAVLNQELLLIIQPEIQEAQLMHLPAVHRHPPLLHRSDISQGSVPPICQRRDKS